MLRGIVFFTDSHAHEEVTVFDTTLRDGEQTPGLHLPLNRNSRSHASSLISASTQSRQGFPASSKAEKETVTAIKKLGLESKICGLARSVKADVDTCLDCNVDMVHVFIPTSDIQRENTINKTRKEVLEITADIIGYIRKHSDMLHVLGNGCHADRLGLPYRGFPDGCRCRGHDHQCAGHGRRHLTFRDEDAYHPHHQKKSGARSMSTATTTSGLRSQTRSPPSKPVHRRCR